MSMPIGCIVPHPPILIPAIGQENLRHVESTKAAMERLSVLVAKAQPDTLVFISPHSPALPEAIAVKGQPVLAGSLADFGARAVSLKGDNDLEFVDSIIEAGGAEGVPISKIGQRFSRFIDTETLDHGIMVPLYYLRQAVDKPIVSLSISYLDYETHYKLGKAARIAADKLNRRICFVASGDLSHRLTPGAPAGYSPDGLEFDRLVEKAVAQGKLSDVMSIDPFLINNAGECGLRSIIALAGAFDGLQLTTDVLSYEGPFGVGYLVAAIWPLAEQPADSEAYERVRVPVDVSVDVSVDVPVGATPATSRYPIDLARLAIERFVRYGEVIEPPSDTPEEFLNKQAGAFVSLKKEGALRGCIGTISPARGCVAEEIIYNAIQSANADPRFSCVVDSELDSLSYSVDVLGHPEPVAHLGDLDPQKYGVIVKQGSRAGLLLPDLEGVSTAEEQVAIAKAKAGIARSEAVELYRFVVTRYK